MLHLCAIVAHGSPSFCCAYRVADGTPSDPGPWWITEAGHRVRPYWTTPIDYLVIETGPAQLTSVSDAAGEPPDDLEESFSIDTRDTSHALLQALGLGGPAQPSAPTRRI